MAALVDAILAQPGISHHAPTLARLVADKLDHSVGCDGCLSVAQICLRPMNRQMPVEWQAFGERPLCGFDELGRFHAVDAVACTAGAVARPAPSVLGLCEQAK